ncbi:MAG: DUF5658 family protein [Blastocatellia bacterium]|nr:DUF5658 family protein [Blastocatellia bacterium]
MTKARELFQDRKMFMYVLVAIVMSGYDAVATMQHIGRGVAAEGNPFMESLIETNALVFFLVKMALTSLCLLICYNFSHLRMARLGIRLTVIIYSFVCAYHVLIVFAA